MQSPRPGGVGGGFTRIGADGKKIPDSPANEDSVWGTLAKTYKVDDKKIIIDDSDPKKKCRQGDILQIRDVKLANGYSYSHHTAVIAEVDTAGRPQTVYQQNIAPPGIADGRIVRKFVFRAQELRAGYMVVYRPEATTNPATMQFTFTNNLKSVNVSFSFNGKPADIGKPNTGNGWRFVWLSGEAKVTLDGKDYTLTTRKAYEFYSAKDGKTGFREIK